MPGNVFSYERDHKISSAKAIEVSRYDCTQLECIVGRVLGISLSGLQCWPNDII